jgi:hypothetical protein
MSLIQNSMMQTPPTPQGLEQFNENRKKSMKIMD